MTAPAFLTRLVTEQMAERRWRTVSTLTYLSAVPGTGRIDVPTDFITDFASVLRAPLMWWLAGGVGSPAAVVHDWLYQRHEVLGRSIDKATADRVFLEALGAWGVWAWRRWPMYTAVAAFGGHAWRTGPARFAALNPKWTAQERTMGQFTPARDVRIAVSMTEGKS
jgi:hypothetical protein